MSEASSSTRLITLAGEVRAAVRAAQCAGQSVGFVPTMGALHEGHLSLVAASLAECDRTVVSIFVNPTQFGPGEDLRQYPRTLEQDLQLLQERGCWLVFAPTVEEMYRPGHETYVDVGSVAASLEGKARPSHFRGVATVVLKLFQAAPADRTYFGQKDYQQTLVVRKLIDDLNLPIEMRVCPIVREPDGLAMSSRNAYLSREERRRAVSLYEALQLAAKLQAAGETDVAAIREKMRRQIAAVGGVELEYLAFLAPGTVREVASVDGPTVVVLAARVGTTRLIDNCLIG